MERGYTRREIAQRMRVAAPGLKIFGTPEQPLEGAPLIEYPLLDAPEGIATMNDLIAEHGIDAIWPHRSANHDLSGITSEVHAAATPEVIGMIDDKVAFSEWLGNDIYRPFSIEAVGVDAIADAYARRRAEGNEVIIKPVIGVSGRGYWRLADHPDISVLHEPDLRVIHPDVYLSAMALEERTKEPQRMVLMDWLPGPEVSIDLLTWRGNPLIHAARTKLQGRRERIQDEHPMIEHVYDVATRLALHGIISMQYRLDKDGNWKMLEINPRPAGGSILSEDAGFGIITDWAKLVAHEIGPDEVVQRHGDLNYAQVRSWQPDLNS